jgi:hypothetical protein
MYERSLVHTGYNVVEVCGALRVVANVCTRKIGKERWMVVRARGEILRHLAQALCATHKHFYQ